MICASGVLLTRMVGAYDPLEWRAFTRWLCENQTTRQAGISGAGGFYVESMSSLGFVVLDSLKFPANARTILQGLTRVAIMLPALEQAARSRGFHPQ